MKKCRSGVVGLVVVLMIGLLAGPGEAASQELEVLQLRYVIEAEKLQRPLGELLRRYRERMDELEEEFSEAGDLKGALAAREASKSEPVVGEIVEWPKEVASTQKIYLESKSQRENQIAVVMGDLDRVYHMQLVALRQRLTKTGRIP